MKQLIISVLLLFSVSFVRAESLNGTYRIEGFANNLDCCISFCKDGSYELKIDELFQKIQSVQRIEQIFSLGNYTINGAQIDLIDSVFGFKMQMFILDNNHIRAFLGFPFLQMQVFTLVKKDCSILSIKEILDKRNTVVPSKEKVLSDFMVCTYEDLAGYKLAFLDNFRYKYSFNDFLISEGIYTRDADRINLWDENLKCSFSVKNGEEVLIRESLPGDKGGGLFFIDKKCVSEKVYEYQDEDISFQPVFFNIPDDSNEPLAIAEVMPQFPEGHYAIADFIYEHIAFPNSLIKNSVDFLVAFRIVVKDNGEVGDIQFVISENKELEDEIARVVKLLPKFIPGRQNRQLVSVWYAITLNFKFIDKGQEPQKEKENDIFIFR